MSRPGTARVARPRATFELYDGTHDPDLGEKYREVNRVFSDEETEEGRRRRLNERTDRQSLAQAEEFDQLADESRLVYVLSALPRKAWEAAKEAHPPRMEPDPAIEVEDGQDQPERAVEADRAFNVNTETLFGAVVMESIIDPDGDPYDTVSLFVSEDECDAWCESLTGPQWDELCGTIWFLNERGSGIPRSSMASSLRRHIDESSKQHAAPESPQPASRVGSRGSSTPTSTQTDDHADPPTPSESSSSENPSGTSTSGT